MDENGISFQDIMYQDINKMLSLQDIMRLQWTLQRGENVLFGYICGIKKFCLGPWL